MPGAGASREEMRSVTILIDNVTIPAPLKLLEPACGKWALHEKDNVQICFALDRVMTFTNWWKGDR